MLEALSSIPRTFSTYLSLDRDPKLLIASQSLVFIATSAQGVVLSIYLSKAGYSDAEIGLILTVSSIVMTVTMLPGGMVADAVGRKKVSSLGLILGAVSLAGYIYAENIYYLLAIASLGGLGSALFGSTITALLADSAKEHDKRNLVFSIAASLTTIAGILGYLAGGIPSILRLYGFGELESYYPVLIISSGSLALSSILMLMVRIEERDPSGGGRALIRIPRRSSGIMIRSIIYAGILFIGVGPLVPQLFSLWLYRRFSIEENITAVLYMVSQAIVGISFIASPAIARRIGSVKTVSLTQGSAAAMLALIALAPSFLAVGIIYTVVRILVNISSPILRSFILSLVDPSERATASGVLSLATSLSSATAPAITGFLMSSVSLESPFYMSGLTVLAAALTYHIMFRRYESEIANR